MIVPEGFLHGSKVAVLGQPFDGNDVGTVRLDGEGGTGFNGYTVQLDDAGATLAGVAAYFSSGEVESLAEEVDQQGAGFHFGGTGAAIHVDRDGYFIGQDNTSSIR